MGIIQKQSLSGAVYSYIGVGLGFIITGFLFPRILSTDEVGLLRLLVSYSTLLAQFAVFGFNTVIVKMFPYFRNNEKGHHGFLGLALLISFAGFLLTIAVYLGFHNYIIANAKEKSQLFIPYFYYVIPLMFFTMLFGIFDTYYRMLYNAVKGIVYKEVVQRVLVILTIILYYFKFIDFYFLVLFYILAFITPTILLLINLVKDKQFFFKPDLSFLSKKLVRQIFSVAFFGIVASYSGVLVQNIDLIMVDHYLGLSYTGIYAITFFFGMLILIPMRTMGKISSVVISEAWKVDDRRNINDIYRKSTLTLGVAGVFIFVGIWGNIDNVFQILGKDYQAGKYVILFISLANLTDVFSGVTSQIIVYSQKYKWLSYLLLVFAVFIVVTNIVFIPIYGIIGAALASFISKFLFNFSKFIFLVKNYRFQPYNFKHILLIITGVVTWFISTLIPQLDNFIFDIFVRSSVITLLYIPSIYFLNISDDVNNVIKSVLRRFIK